MSSLIADQYWGVLIILLPLLGGLISFVWTAAAKFIGLTTVSLVGLSVLGLGSQLLTKGVYHHSVGGWGAPLGINLYADGLSLFMLMVTALVGLGISLYALGYFDRDQARRFWPLWLLLMGGLNALFLSADIFNLYVTLEMVGLAGVGLASLPGSRAALSGAMRYLMATLLGSLAYLLGVALLYHSTGTVDIPLLAERLQLTPAVWAALGLICAGLALKSALFPLHFWLPKAHASASAPVSALLSALVAKASFYILLRLWLTIFSPGPEGVGNLLGVLGMAAILWGSFQALQQTRLKLMIAYSTVAQMGYLFLVFPLVVNGAFSAWVAVAYLMISHGLAKSAMFLVAGNLIHFGGHDRIADLDRAVQRLPITVGAFALAGVSIMGLPPSGGFIGKWLLLSEALNQGRWDLVIVMMLGGVLAAAYVFRVLGFAFTQAQKRHEPKGVPATMEWSALLLAIAAIVLGFLASPLMQLLGVGAPVELTGVGQ
ncbi:MAG: proton-conducting transporter membrane subunit [Sedimenticola sp.]|nr:proton-conducting transporter membrane subunit [Sedimenticola sp.]